MLPIKTARRGFTLVELLMVIALVGVLGTGTAIIAIGPNLQKARDGRRKADLEAIRSALEIYRNENKYYPTSLNSLVTGNQMSVVPVDPTTGAAYNYGYREVDNTTCDNSSSTEYCTKYELCANLERANDPDINNAGSTCWLNAGTSPGNLNFKKTQL